MKLSTPELSCGFILALSDALLGTDSNMFWVFLSIQLAVEQTMSTVIIELIRWSWLWAGLQVSDFCYCLGWSVARCPRFPQGEGHQSRIWTTCIKAWRRRPFADPPCQQTGRSFTQNRLEGWLPHLMPTHSAPCHGSNRCPWAWAVRFPPRPEESV